MLAESEQCSYAYSNEHGDDTHRSLGVKKEHHARNAASVT